MAQPKHGRRTERSPKDPPHEERKHGPLGRIGEIEAAYYLAAVVQSSDDAIIGKTLDGTIVSWNRAAEQLYGYTADEAIGRSVSLIIPQDRSRELDDILERLRRGEGISHFETIRSTKDGRLIPISLTVSPILNSSGEIIGASAIARDSSDRLEVEELRRRLQEELEQLVAERTAELRRSNETLQQEIARRKTSEETMRFIAEATIELAGSLDYDTTLANVANLVVPRMADWCAIDLVEDDGSVRQVTVVHSDPSKTELVRELRKRHPVEIDSPGGIAEVIRTGESLLYGEIEPEDYQALERNPDYIRIVQSLGLRSALIVPLRARGRTFGTVSLVMAESGRLYSEEDISSAEKLANSCALAVDNARLYRRAKYEIGERERAQAELNELNETLEHRVAERTAELEQANLRLKKEIHDRQRAERALARTNTALLQSNRELQDFAHVASHDLQEPLRKITSFAELLLDEYLEMLGEEGRGYLERIDDAGRRMTALINDLLTFSRVRTQKQHFEKIDLNAVAGDVLSDLTTRIEEVDGRVEVQELPAIEADATQMRQLFQNLIGNALKFYREGVPPVVRVEAELEDGSEVCRITVADNGIGFDVSHLEQMFSPFHRLHGRQFAGTGMGLAICRRIAERHGGHITARSEPGQGSQFIIELPARHQSENDEQHSSA